MASPISALFDAPDPRPSSVRTSKTRFSADDQSLASSVSSLPYRASNPSISSLYASTTTPTGSRSASPTGRSTPSRTVAGSVFGGGTPSEQQAASSDRSDDPRNLILQAFVPHIAVHTSVDTHELVADKGFKDGLWELLRPYGERIQGKVTVRDSIGASKTHEDFGVRFVQLGDGLETSAKIAGKGSQTNGNRPVPDFVIAQRLRTGGNVAQVEDLVDRHLAFAEDFPSIGGEDYMNFKDSLQNPDVPSKFYTLYLRKLLSGIPLAPHETFSHPVACIIAISSRNNNPIDALRKLYDESSQGDKRFPSWVNNDYLRYYVLVHDEERDDISKSLTLFEQMKRHFGLHCHLLRLRSSQCVATDDDSIGLPQCEWRAAPEELAEIQARESQDEPEDSFPCVFESDTTAIRTFIREMVTQSVVPSMERNVATWNDQVASRRRGISGRFMSVTKRFTVFGGNSRTSAGSSAGGSNYDITHGFYRPDAPEALMRKLADHAFMLRDWKLAYSTYDLLRQDFNNDKAWKYHAAANEMAAVSGLLIPQNMSSKMRTETIDQMLETASYSYITRCSTPYGALRCLALGMELLRVRGGSATEDAARWGSRLLEHKILGVAGDALVKERIAACYASKRGTGAGSWGARPRKSALWSILAAEGWLGSGKSHQAKQSLESASRKYSKLPHPDSLSFFPEADEFLRTVRKDVDNTLYPDNDDSSNNTVTQSGVLGSEMGEESETFETRPQRRSLMGATAPPLTSMGSAPLQGSLDVTAGTTADNQFERE